jgi:hypothetical protein
MPELHAESLVLQVATRSKDDKRSHDYEEGDIRREKSQPREAAFVV